MHDFWAPLIGPYSTHKKIKPPFQLSNLLLTTHAIPTRAAPTQTHHETWATVASAHACPRWSAHHPTAGQSVMSMRTVHQIWLVSTANARTRVRACAVWMRTVECAITCQSVCVTRDTLAIHSPAAIWNQVSCLDSKCLHLTNSKQVNFSQLKFRWPLV